MARNRRNNNNSNKQGKDGNKDYKFSKPKDLRCRDKEEPLNHVITAAKSSNDPSWYTHIYAQVKDVASLSLNIPVGAEFNPMQKGVQWDDDPQNPYRVDVSCHGQAGAKVMPGVMAIRIAPTIGTCLTSNSAANTAAQQLYTLVRKANSGAINYDKTDLMMYIMAMDSCYMLYESLIRIYDVYENYNYMSRYMPNSILKALGCDPSLEVSLSDFRTLLDKFAYRLASLRVPDQFDFIKRHSWLFSNIYKDSPSDRSQLYMYVPDGFYMLKEGVDGKPTHLEYIQTQNLFEGGMISSLQQIRIAMDKLTLPIMGSQDVATMAGDLTKAFGEAGMITIRAVDDHEAMKPVYNLEVISQMMNSTIFSTNSLLPSSLNIVPNLSSTSDGPYLEQKPLFSCDQGIKKWRKTLLNFHSESITPEEVMVATRLMTTVGDPVQDGNLFRLPALSWGTEIAVGCRMYVLADRTLRGIGMHDIGLPQDIQLCNSQSAEVENMAKNYHQFAQVMVNLSAFAHHPTVYLFEDGLKTNISETYGTLNYMGVIQETDCYTWLDDDKIGELNDVAILSEFAAKDYSIGM